MAEDSPVQIFSAEHFVRTHHVWTCTACPVHDPRTGELLGVVDVSGPAETVHPTTVALVGTAVKLAEASLWRLHERRLDALRAVAAPVLAASGGPGLVVDDHGWVAAFTGDALPGAGRGAGPGPAGPGARTGTVRAGTGPGRLAAAGRQRCAAGSDRLAPDVEVVLPDLTGRDLLVHSSAPGVRALLRP